MLTCSPDNFDFSNRDSAGGAGERGVESRTRSLRGLASVDGQPDELPPLSGAHKGELSGLQM